MKDKNDPQMAKLFETTYRFGLVIRRDELQFTAAVLNESGLSRDGKFLFIRRANKPDRIEGKLTHCLETFSAEPLHTACW